MANTIGNPTLVSDKARENSILSYNSTLTSSPSAANPIFRVRRDTTTLVDFSLDASTPLTSGAVDGSASFNFVSPNAVAVGGAASVPNNYQVIGRDAAVHLSGPITATDGISVGQVVDAAAITATAPAS